MTTVTDPTELKIESIIGFKQNNTNTNSNNNNNKQTYNILTLGIIDGNMDENKCDIRDAENDQLYPQVPWSNIYTLHSLNEDKKLFKTGDRCYCVWQNFRTISVKVKHRKKSKIKKNQFRNKTLSSFTTTYYSAVFIKKDLRKKQVTVKYDVGTDGGDYILPVNVYIGDYAYPTVVKPQQATHSDALQLLLQNLISKSPECSYPLSITNNSQTQSQSQPQTATESTLQSRNSFDNTNTFESINKHELSKPAKKAHKKRKRKKRKVSKILRNTRKKAQSQRSGKSKTQINASTILEFVLRYQNNRNASEIFRNMKRDGFHVGKRPHIEKWVRHPPEFYRKIIAEKGYDYIKFSMTYLCTCEVVIGTAYHYTIEI
eukprot:554309_1